MLSAHTPADVTVQRLLQSDPHVCDAHVFQALALLVARSRLSHKKFTFLSASSNSGNESANLSMAAWKFFGEVFRINAMLRLRKRPMIWD